MIVNKGDTTYPAEKSAASTLTVLSDLPPPYTSRQGFDAPFSSDSPEESGHYTHPDATLIPRDLSPGAQGSNNIEIRTRKQNILGTFYITPDVSSIGEISAQKRQGCGCHCKRNEKMPDALFQTRHGASALTLATLGATEKKIKSVVDVYSRTGNVTIDVSSIDPTKKIDLDVYTRRGHVLVLVPKSFSGCVQLKSRRGGTTVLPAPANSKTCRKAHGDRSAPRCRLRCSASGRLGRGQ